MSQPSFPENTNLSREDVINQIISSVAMEELGLSHIINAEGEKLQYALGTLKGVTGPTGPLTIDELMELNKSIHKTLDGTMQNQIFLRDKLQTALSASIMQGPSGPTGPIGLTGATGPIGPTGAGLEILDYFESLQALKDARGNGNSGDVYVAGGLLYISDGTQWIEVKNLGGPTGPTGATGPTGPTGSTGAGLEILDYFDSLQALIAAHGPGNRGDVYVAGGRLYISDGTQWIEVKNLGGPTGPAGVGLVILGYYETLDALIAAKGNGNPNDVYVAGGLLYISDGARWTELENLGGPTGPIGPTGPAASSYTVIPFCSQKAPRVRTNSSGNPTSVALLGFGYMDIYINDPNISVPLDSSDGSFNLGLSTGENRQVVFSLPFDMKLNSIYATVGNFARFVLPPSGRMIFPSVQLYYAEPNSNTFNPIPNAFARPAEGIDPASAEAATMRAASKTGLSIELEAGTRIAIGGLMTIDGDNAPRDYYLYFTGGLGLTPWIK